MLASSPTISASGTDQRIGTSVRISSPIAGPTLTISDSVVNAPPETLKYITATSESVVRDRRSFTVMIAITKLGNVTVVLMIVCVAGLFLTLTRHKYSALLLVVATAGGLVLDAVLKLQFERPRPHILTWGTEAGGWSFPSGHAMSATIAYSTVAYLAARLHRRRWARWLTMPVAMLLILVICGSRVYLGVHYPSDVLAGIIIGLAWAAFCMATLEGIQRFSEHRAPRVKKDEA